MTRRGPPESKIPTEILELLIVSGRLRFTDIKNRLNTTKQSLSKNLKLLLEKDLIQAEKSGKEVYYEVKKTPNTLFERNIISFAIHYYIDLIEFLEDEREKETQFEDLFGRLTTFLGAYFLYLILKSLQTGDNWLQAFQSNKMAALITNYLMSIILKKPLVNIHPLSLFNDEMTKKMLKDMHDILEKNNRVGNLEKYAEALRKKYPKQMQLIDFIENSFIDDV